MILGAYSIYHQDPRKLVSNGYTKQNAIKKGEVEKYKARFMAKGYSQEYGINHNYLFDYVAR